MIVGPILLGDFSAKINQFPGFLYQASSILKKNSFSFCFVKFSKLNDFRVNSFAKEVALVIFPCPELAFSINSPDSAFSIWHYSSERKRGISGNVQIFNQLQRFLSNLKIWHYTDFRNLQNGHDMDIVFLPKRRQFFY